MRNLFFATMAVLAPVTFAQAAAVSSTSSGMTVVAPAQPGMTTAEMNYTPAPPDPNNCGTPTEPKSCPPLPRVPLNHYSPRHSG